jgi:hypothetical protein
MKSIWFYIIEQTDDEICILEVFPYANFNNTKNIDVQLKNWHNKDLFIIENGYARWKE